VLVSLAGLSAIGAATISAYALTNFTIFAEQSALHEAASVPIPDPAVSTMLKDVQLLQQRNAALLQQNAIALERLAAGSSTQQADLARISDQLSSLVARTDALQKAAAPITTSAIPIPQPRSRAQVVRASRKEPSRLPKPAGPVSVGGFPLNPAGALESGAR
jgi:hypothetical protein